MLSSILQIFKMFWLFFKPVLIILGVVIAVFIIDCAFWFIYYKYKGLELPKMASRKIKKASLWKQFLIDIPSRYVLDMYEKEEDYFNECGIHIFCGEQGSGKTMAMTERILKLQKAYPKCKTITNFGLTTETDSLDYWQMLIDYTNGKQGVVVGIDEIQNWFMSGKNQLPEGMLEVVTQNRKNRRILLCTAQVFTRVSKAIREQVTLVYEPHTFLGCFTVVLVYKPQFDSEGNVKKRKWRNMYCFTHTEELRNAYDTYKAIHILGQEGFKEMQQQATINNWIVSK